MSIPRSFATNSCMCVCVCIINYMNIISTSFTMDSPQMQGSCQQALRAAIVAWVCGLDNALTSHTNNGAVVSPSIIDHVHYVIASRSCSIRPPVSFRQLIPPQRCQLADTNHNAPTRTFVCCCFTSWQHLRSYQDRY